MEIILDSEDVRYILQNAGKIKKDGRCTVCNGSGWINWNGETGTDTKPGRSDGSDLTRDEDECESCDGVGFVW